MELNQAQKQAVACKEGPCMVLAGPGSGKTLTIASRIEYLITRYGVRPEEILVITFTRYAAEEMRQRFHQVMGEGEYPVTFGTFHGFYYGILKWAYGASKIRLLTGEEKKALLSQILAELSVSEAPEEEEDLARDLAGEIGSFKNRKLKLEEHEPKCCSRDRFRVVFQNYEKRKKELGKIDFEDMLLYCLRLFQKRPDILAKWQSRFSYILVDEFQDINQVQYDVLRLLAEPKRNLFVVGDDDQSIYGFRGARPGIMLEFEKDYPKAEKIVLGTNYRSGGHIVEGALRVIENNKKRCPKKLKAQNGVGEAVHIQEVKDPVEESRFVLSQIRRLAGEGIPLSQMAALFRTDAEGRALAETLAAQGIPFVMKERPEDLYAHFAVKDLRAYLSLSQGDLEKKHFLRIANRPNRYIGRDSLQEERVTYETLRNFYCDKSWMQDRIDQLEWDMKMIQEQTPYAAIQYIRGHIGYDEFLKEYGEYRQTAPDKWLEALDEVQELSKACATIPEWITHVEEREKRKEQKKAAAGEGVSLLTMHGAKGLEFDTVFIIRGNEGVIPYKKAKLDDEIEEERRLFYVAMTRAKKRLFISYPREKNGKDASPSRFVGELFHV